MAIPVNAPSEKRSSAGALSLSLAPQLLLGSGLLATELSNGQAFWWVGGAFGAVLVFRLTPRFVTDSAGNSGGRYVSQARELWIVPSTLGYMKHYSSRLGIPWQVVAGACWILWTPPALLWLWLMGQFVWDVFTSS